MVYYTKDKQASFFFFFLLHPQINDAITKFGYLMLRMHRDYGDGRWKNMCKLVIYLKLCGIDTRKDLPSPPKRPISTKFEWKKKEVNSTITIEKTFIGIVPLW